MIIVQSEDAGRLGRVENVVNILLAWDSLGRNIGNVALVELVVDVLPRESTCCDEEALSTSLLLLQTQHMGLRGITHVDSTPSMLTGQVSRLLDEGLSVDEVGGEVGFILEDGAEDLMEVCMSETRQRQVRQNTYC